MKICEREQNHAEKSEVITIENAINAIGNP